MASSPAGVTRAPATARMRLDALWRALALIWQAHRGYALLSALSIVAQAGFMTAALWVGKRLVDSLVVAIASNGSEATREVVIYALAELGCMMMFEVARNIADYASEVLGKHVEATVNLLITTHTSRLDVEHFETPSFYDLLQKTRENAGFRPLLLFQDLLRLLHAICMSAGLVSLVIVYNPLIALVALAAALPDLKRQLNAARLRISLIDWRTPEGRWLSYYMQVLTDIEYAKELRSFGSTEYFLGSMRQRIDTLIAQDRSVARQRTSSIIVGRLSSRGIYYVAYIAILFEAMAGSFTLGTVTMLAGALRSLQEHMGSIMRAMATSYEHVMFLEHLFQLLGLQPRIQRPAPADEVQPPEQPRQGFVLTGVSFCYPGKSERALRDLHLSISAGEIVAIVGENGSGKSTFAKLLSRIYDPTEGTIELDGIDLRRFDPEVYRRRIGVMYQDYVKYQLTLGDNLRLGNTVTPERMAEVLGYAGVQKFANGLPHGLDTLLGRRFDGGVELSEGQWQRIALARAILRDPPILILDEPSAALDAEQEYEIFEKLRQVAAGRTVVFVSHRLSTVRMADRILVFAGGEIVEDGTHDELMAQNGRYTRMFSLQASAYIDAGIERNQPHNAGD